MTAIAFRAATTNDGQGATATITIPAATQQGDVILLHVFASTANALTIPAGFTQIGTTVVPATGVQSFICGKIAGASDGGTVVSVSLGGTPKWCMSAWVGSGCDQTTPWDAANSAIVIETVAGTTHATPAETVNAVGSWAVFGVADRSSPGSTSFTISAGSIEAQTSGFGGGGSSSLAVADSAGTVATGALAARTWTGTVSVSDAVMWTVVLIPASQTQTTAPAKVYGQLPKKLLDAFVAGGGVAGVPKLKLVAPGYTFNTDTQAVWSDISTHEVANGNGYLTGGDSLTESTSYDTPTHRTKVTSPSVTWTGAGAGFDTVGAVLVFDTGTPATSLLGCFLDFGGTVNVGVGSQLILAPDATLGWLFGGLLAAA